MTIDNPVNYVYEYLGALGKTPLTLESQSFYYIGRGIYIYITFFNGKLYRKEILKQDLLSDPELVIHMISLELTFLA